MSHPEVGIEGPLGHITADMDGLVLVTLTLDAAFTLGQITGTPRGVQIMQGDEAILHVGAGTHLGGAADQHAHLAAADFGKEVALFCLGIRIVNKGHLLRQHPALDQFFPNIVIDREGHFLRPFLIRALGLFCFRRGEVAEHKLRQLFVLAVSPVLQNILHTLIDLRALFIGQQGIDDALIQTELSPVRGVG